MEICIYTHTHISVSVYIAYHDGYTHADEQVGYQVLTSRFCRKDFEPLALCTAGGTLFHCIPGESGSSAALVEVTVVNMP